MPAPWASSTERSTGRCDDRDYPGRGILLTLEGNFTPVDEMPACFIPPGVCRKGGRLIRAAPLMAIWMAAVSLPVRSENLHFTYLWHLEQPIYWPDQQTSGADRYERAWESIQRKDGGAAHPSDNLRDIFSLADRVAVYQYRVKDSIDAFDQYGESGAQISYSGGLIENTISLGNANQLGYSPKWYSSLRTVRGWTTAGGKPRCDIVIFPFHHPLLPLCDDSAIRKEIQLYKSIYPDAWGNSPGLSHGLFPPEMAFSERIIPLLAAEGVQWVFVSGEKVSRACSDFPVVLGSGGINCDPPNKADQLNPAQSNYYRVSISRGCAPAEAYPYAFTPHRAQYVDANTGAISQVIVVPCSQSIGWKDGYAPLGLSDFNALQVRNDPNRPMLCVLAHDGDNAWGGGYSYYQEATPNLVSSTQSAGYVATTVEQYLANHAVPAGDVVHIEDGAWVNADGDFGSPVMLNWNWPLVNSSGQIDIAGGWAEDERNWAVITAAQNRVETAEQIAGGAGAIDIRKVLYPDASTSHAERAWHYFLTSLNSGYMYYGTSGDMEVKPTLACNEAVEHADAVIGNASADATAPTIWLPQRHPWNPGSLNFGPQYGYQQYQSNGDFWIWTFAHDVSGIVSVALKYRTDNDGANSTTSTQNETYDGGSEVGAWQSLTMTKRVFPSGNFFNSPSIDFFELPAYIADEYYVQVTGLRSVLIDYYVEAVDTKGYTKKSPIQHVWIGDGSGASGGGGGTVVSVVPDPPVAGQNVTVQYNPVGRPLAAASQVKMHYGFNQWSPVISPDVSMTWNAGNSRWKATVPVLATAVKLDAAFNNGSGTWDNNSGADWHFTVSGTQTSSWTMDGIRDADSVLVAQNNGSHLWAGRKGEVAQWDAFLADENDNAFKSWFDTNAGTGAATGANGGVLEGTLSLSAQYSSGNIPSTVYLAFTPYVTPDGGALVKTTQVPASVNNDGNVDASEYIAVNLCTLAGAHPAADLDADCDLDADDFDVFTQCMNGPDSAPALTCPAGANADLDNDNDVDQSDFARLQKCLSGSNLLPANGC
jgi:hypothetical protein